MITCHTHPVHIETPNTKRLHKMSALHQSYQLPMLDQCPIQSLPNELLDAIMQHLSHVELLQCSQVSTKWFDLVNERLQRTEACSLVTDFISCEHFNTNDKLIRHLILRNATLWGQFKTEKIRQLESFYFVSDRFTGEDIRYMSSMLEQCESLAQVTLRTGTAPRVGELEELLQDLREVRTLCLIVDHMGEETRKEWMDFFSDVFYFFNEIIIQVMNPCNEIIVICSDKASLHPHVHDQYSKAILVHVSPALVETVISNTKTKITHLEMQGSDTFDETLAIISATPHLEYLSLDEFSSTTQAWGKFFNSLDKNGSLKQLNLSNCFNITSQEITELTTLHLDRLEIDLCNSLKITNIEQFLFYCLSHVLKLKISFIYNENVLNNFLDVFQTVYDREVDAILKELDIDINRVNHCSDKVSSHIEEFKFKLGHLANVSSVSVNVNEIFSRVSQN